jgi:hypothetical protein
VRKGGKRSVDDEEEEGEGWGYGSGMDGCISVASFNDESDYSPMRLLGYLFPFHSFR